MSSAPLKKVSAKPEAELVPRPGDEVLRSDELQQFELFASLKKPISVEKFPGSMVLRRVSRGDVICQQGERGHSAFYIVSHREMERLRAFRANLPLPADDKPASTNESATITEDMPPFPLATAYLLGGPSAHVGQSGSGRDEESAVKPGLFARIFGRGPASPTLMKPSFIPNDGPTEIDYQTRQASMFAGDVFGEMSCMTLAPRSATVVANADGYMVEFLRNIFDQMQKDPGYRQRTDEIYARRVLSSHLRRLEFFQDLSDAQLNVLRDAAHLEVVEPGTVICDEGDQADSIYLIRSGVVQVVRGAHVALRAEHVVDWPAFCAALLKGAPDSAAAVESRESATLIYATAPSPSGDPASWVWSWFTPSTQATIRRIASSETSSAEDCARVIQAINQLLRRREFVAAPDGLPVLTQPSMRATIEAFPHGSAGAKKHWSELEVRIAGTLILQTLFPNFLPSTEAKMGPPDILAYLARGDCFGEMALVLGVPRQATCIAYDHPAEDTSRRPGRVELVRIDAAAFQRLLESSEPLRTSVERLVARRYVDIVGSDLRHVSQTEASVTHTTEFRDAGLVQGQSLLLIDLDRCTRCGDCVRACVRTHDDGYSRLFLDGPRFDRFLVPSACRQCLNPVCMIGCPVGSIQRGNNGQIEIRDWCIGCSLCARQCPYDSIQMHDTGIIPEQTIGWQFAAASAVGNADWTATKYRPRSWSVGLSPVTWTLDLVEQLSGHAANHAWQARRGQLPEPIYFRYPFPLTRDQLRQSPCGLHVSSQGLPIRVWLNGVSVLSAESATEKKKPKEHELQARIDTSQLRVGENVLAVEVSPPATAAGQPFSLKYGQLLLSARLDALPKVGALATATAGAGVDLEVELVERTAVVCDLCSSLARQRPACVEQCPHDAAIRVNARFEFPVS